MGEYITEQKMDLIRFGEDAKPSRRNAETSGRETKPSKCLNNKVWRGRQTKQEMDTTQNGRGTPSQAGKDAIPGRESNETEQKMELLRFGEDAKPSRETDAKPSRKCTPNQAEKGASPSHVQSRQ